MNDTEKELPLEYVEKLYDIIQSSSALRMLVNVYAGMLPDRKKEADDFILKVFCKL